MNEIFLHKNLGQSQVTLNNQTEIREPTGKNHIKESIIRETCRSIFAKPTGLLFQRKERTFPDSQEK